MLRFKAPKIGSGMLNRLLGRHRPTMILPIIKRPINLGFPTQKTAPGKRLRPGLKTLKPL